MNEIARCSRCIVPTSLPSVKLDDKGVCNFCRRFEKLDAAMGPDYFTNKTKEFEAIVSRVKKLNRLYDCILPLSGGKDSSYAVYLCSKVYKLKCLCYTFDNGYLSEYAKKNVENVTNAAGADHFYFTPNRNKMEKQYGLFLKKSGAFCPVCMRGIQAGAQMLIDHFKPPLAVYGTGRRISYLGIYPEIFQGGDLSFYKNVMKGEASSGELKSLMISPLSRQINKLKEQFFRLAKMNISMLGTYTYYVALYDYIEPNFKEIRKTIETQMGWRAPEGEFEHMDCQGHDIPPYIHTLRFPELTPVTLYNSNLIRLGLMTRAEALEAEKTVVKTEPKVLEPFLKQIGVSKEEFKSSVVDWHLTDSFRNKADEKRRALFNRLIGKA